MDHKEAIKEEDRRIKELQRTVDLALIYLRRAKIDKAEAENLVSRVRAKAVHLFPDKEDVFDLIYLPRFRRVIADRFALH